MAGEMSVRIGQKIRKRRMEMGLNQREFADLVRIHLGGNVPVDGQRVSDWERAINKPSERYLTAIAEVADRDLGWFYENENTKTPELFASDNQVEDIRQEFSGKVDQIIERLDVGEADRAGITQLLREQSELLAAFAAEVQALREVVALLPAVDVLRRLSEDVPARELPPASEEAPPEGQERRRGDRRRSG